MDIYIYLVFMENITELDIKNVRRIRKFVKWKVISEIIPV